MSKDKISYSDDVQDFIRSLGDFLEASPNENQYIQTQILKQIKEGAKFKETRHLKGKRGYEPITVLEARGLKIAKRIFHPRDIAGIDFVISKLDPSGFIGTSVVQVKRNHGKPFFALVENKHTHELTQLRNFRRWPSSYYLMIDETSKPPLDCFILTSELVSTIYEVTRCTPVSYKRLRRINIPNELVHRYCRGTRMFYKAFYDCRRGSWAKTNVFLESASEYVVETMRLLVEVLVEREVPTLSKI